MEQPPLHSTITVKTVSEDARKGVFEIDGLYAGYGLTMGNAIRRGLLSSLPGAAVTYIKIKNAPHEFSTLSGVREDLIELMLNFKKLRFIMHTDEPQTLLVKGKGEMALTGANVEVNAQVEVVNPEEPLATLTAKNAELEVEVTVERGMGYSAVESRKAEKLAVGLVGVDAFFSPVTKVNYTVENMRMGDRTDYNRLHLEIETDGTQSPSQALQTATGILKEHFEKVSTVEVQKFEMEKPEPVAKKKGKKK